MRRRKDGGWDERFRGASALNAAAGSQSGCGSIIILLIVLLVCGVGGRACFCSDRKTEPQAEQPLVAEHAKPGPKPSPAVSNARMRVANTGGEGVFLRTTPNLADKSATALSEGSQLRVRQRVTKDDGDWFEVETVDGNSGWLPARYLAPSPVPSASASGGSSAG